jgi:hypothetical protein
MAAARRVSVEGLNTKVRLIVGRAYGFDSADAALVLRMPAAGPTTLRLPARASLHPVKPPLTHIPVRRAHFA